MIMGFNVDDIPRNFLFSCNKLEEMLLVLTSAFTLFYKHQIENFVLIFKKKISGLASLNMLPKNQC